MIPAAAAAIVAGGRGTRMGGVTKALLPFGGRTILEAQLDVLWASFARVFVVANDPAPFAPFGVEVVGDVVPGKGAPGGVHAALVNARAEWVFCVASDMPLLARAPVELLAARREGSEAVVAMRGGFPEPLFAFYAAACGERFGEALRQGDVSLKQLLGRVRALRVPEAELAAVDPGLRSLENVNTPEELERLVRPGR